MLGIFPPNFEVSQLLSTEVTRVGEYVLKSTYIRTNIRESDFILYPFFCAFPLQAERA